MNQRPFNEKVDVYSFGFSLLLRISYFRLILYEILTGNQLFPEYEEWDEFCNAICSGVRPRIPSDCLPSLSLLMQRCWDANPNERPR